jgi:Lon protease-like protein
MAVLPLFPLGTVLMPGARLPLQVFEPRYLQLLSDLVEHQDERPPLFGVVAIREGFEVGDDGVSALYPVGCAARLTHAAAMGEDRFLIVSTGIARFHLDTVDEAAGTPYLLGLVTWLDEPLGDRDAVADLATRLGTELKRYRDDVGAEPLEPPHDPAALAWWVPQAITLDLGDRQLLLAASDTEARLRLALQLVRRERAVLDSLGAVGRPPDPPVNLN